MTVLWGMTPRSQKRDLGHPPATSSQDDDFVGVWTKIHSVQQPLSMETPPSPLSSRATPRDLQFRGPVLEMFSTESIANRLLKHIAKEEGKRGMHPTLTHCLHTAFYYHLGVARKACNSVHAGITQPWPVISPTSLIEYAANRCNGEFAGMRVLRSRIFPSFHRKAVVPFASIEKPTTSSRLFTVLQQPATVAKAPGSVPMSCMPVALVHRKE